MLLYPSPKKRLGQAKPRDHQAQRIGYNDDKKHSYDSDKNQKKTSTFKKYEAATKMNQRLKPENNGTIAPIG